MNHLEFQGLRVDKDPYDFTDKVQKITQIMGVTSIKNEALDSY